jgi:HD-like signal output (HDOD) protein/CheY-like chemotaxis protein
MNESTKKKILFVDDELNVLRGLRRMLHTMRNEWEVDFAPSGTKALEKMDETHYDVLVTDMRMPEMDGSQLLDLAKQKHPSTIRFVLSGQSQEEVIFRSVGPAHQFLSKPCDAEIIRKTIQASLSLRELMRNEAIRNIVSKVESLPTLPRIYMEVTEELRKEDASMHKVGEIIEQDLGMSSQILKLVNSSFFGIPNHITDIHQAVNFLGIEVIRSLVLSVGAFSKFKLSQRYEGIIGSLVNESLKIGGCGKAIIHEEGGNEEDQENIFAAGLLHKLGELIFMSYLPKEYRNVQKEMQENKLSLEDAEKKVFGASYAEVGAFLLGIWGLKDIITEAIAYQAAPSECSRNDNILLTALHCAHVFINEQKMPQQEDEKSDANFFRIDMKYIESAGITNKISKWREICHNKCKENS